MNQKELTVEGPDLVPIEVNVKIPIVFSGMRSDPMKGVCNLRILLSHSPTWIQCAEQFSHQSLASTEASSLW